MITCYNLARYLPEAIESALDQSVQPLEVIVVDDGSDDATPDVVRRYPSVRYIHRENAGASAARNTGAAASKGDFLIFLDADDRLTPTAVESGIGCFSDNPNCGFVYGRGVEFDAERGFLPMVDQVVPAKNTYAQLLETCFIWMIHTVMYSRAAFTSVGGYDETFRSASVEDYALNLAIARDFPIASHAGLVAECRVRRESSSRDLGRMLRNVWLVMKKQRVYTENDLTCERARRVGLRKWRSRFVAGLSRSVVNRILAGPRDATLRRDFATLTRHGPAAVLVSVASWLRHTV